MKRVLLVLILGLLILISGCQAKDVSADDNKIGIRGVVKQIVVGKDGITALVEGKIEADTVHDKASVTINRNTIIQNTTGKILKISDIKEGTRLEIIFKGPVAESYPVQGVAKLTRIISEDEKE